MVGALSLVALLAAPTAAAQLAPAAGEKPTEPPAASAAALLAARARATRWPPGEATMTWSSRGVSTGTFTEFSRLCEEALYHRDSARFPRLISHEPRWLTMTPRSPARGEQRWIG
jgi:hypothetical protein